MTALRRFVADLFGAYADGFRVARGLPLLFAAIMLWEFAQHAIEVQAGYYDSLASAKALSLDPHRMALGWIKMILVYVGGFFAIRYLVQGEAAGVMRPSLRTVVRYVPYVLYSLILFGIILYAGNIVPPASVTPVRAVVGLAQIAIEPLLMAWIVSAATDGPVRGPVQSARYTGWFYIRGLALFFVGRLPINAAHQMLGRSAIGLPRHWVWPMLALDAVVVGLLVAIIPAIYVRVVRRIAEARAA